MFLVDLTYVKDLSEVDALLESHVEFLKEQYAAGRFLASGRKVPRTGGVILAVADSRDDLLGVLANDPFALGGVARYEVTEFMPSMACDALAHLCGK